MSLSSAQFNLGRVIGPALAGVALVAGSAGWAFTANAISFGAVVVALLLVRLPAQVRSAGEGIVRRMKEGARLASRIPGCRSPIVLIAIVALIGSPFIALVPAVAIEEFHKQAGGTSVLVTAQGVGAVAGALMLAPLAALGRKGEAGHDRALRPSGRSRALRPRPFVRLGRGGDRPCGASYIGVLSGLNTVVQVHAPPEARGRILGLYMLALGTIYPIGALVQGQLADLRGIRAVTAGSGVVLLATLVVVAAAAPAIFRGLGGSGGYLCRCGGGQGSPCDTGSQAGTWRRGTVGRMTQALVDERTVEQLARRIAELGGRQRARVFHLSWWTDRLLAASMYDPEFRATALPVRRRLSRA